MSVNSSFLPPVQSPEDFESLCLDLFREIWNDPNAQKVDRSGQRQSGVDVVGRHNGGQIGVNCKQKDALQGKRLSAAKLTEEVEKAKVFEPPLASFCLATTSPRDAVLQEAALKLSLTSGFEVNVWSWDDIAEALFHRIGLLRTIFPKYWPAYDRHEKLPPQRITVTRLPNSADRLFGREMQLTQLAAVWTERKIRVLTLVAWGGVGKTSLVAKFVSTLASRNFDGADYFDWSFYSQGSSDASNASADAFVDAALRFFGDAATANSEKSAWDKGSQLARLLATRRALLVLDGLEPLQHPPGPLAGDLKDPAITALLRGLALRNAGLCVVTTRERVSDLMRWEDGGTVQQWKLEHLSISAGVQLLKSLGVDGSAAEMAKAVEEVQGHPLTLNLLGRYLKAAHGGDVRQRDLVSLDEADEEIQNRHAFRAIAAYERWFKTEWQEGHQQLNDSLLDHPFTTGSPPDWAAAWGEDRYGVFGVVWVGKVEQKFRYIPRGSFLMGSPESEDGRFEQEGTPCLVTLTEGYWIADTPCTQELWMEVMGNNPSRFESPRRPVEQVSWVDVQDFLERLKERVPGLEANLPTETQWEHACRAGTRTSTYAGELKIHGANNAPLLDEIAWYGGNSGAGFELKNGYDSTGWKEKQFPHETAGSRDVGLKRPNAWGLYDMLGNVWEWCADLWEASPAEMQEDPSGSQLDSFRVFRGGAWVVGARSVRAACRGRSEPSVRKDNLGFRLSVGRSQVVRHFVTILTAVGGLPNGSTAIAEYEGRFKSGGERGRQQLAVLRLLGLFDRPTDAKLLRVLRRPPAIAGLTEPVVDLNETAWRLAVMRLVESQLIIENDGALDAHPLIREYFGRQLREKNPEAWRSAHSRLFNHLKDSTEHHPDGLAALQPLYQAIHHGCQAGRHQEALDVYIDRILRGTGDEGFYSWRKLGAFGANLGAIAGFFDTPWSRVFPSLSEAGQAWVLSEAALSLRALGRLREASEPMRAGMHVAVRLEDWKNAAIRAGNLSEFELTLGEVTAAVDDAEQSVVFADRSRDAFQRMARRTTLADARHQAGDEATALSHFREAERLQFEGQPSFPLLFSLRGYQYCELLLASAELAAGSGKGDDGAGKEACAEVERRAAQTLLIAERNSGLLEIALDHVSLGRARLYRAILDSRASQAAEDAQAEIEKAVAGLRAAGQLDRLPHGLLTRAWLRFVTGDEEGALVDLDEAQEIAERGSMRLFLADVALYRARFFSDRDALATARRLVDECGYGRRRAELAILEERLMGTN